jgi:enterochelin esterase-like enzyme
MLWLLMTMTACAPPDTGRVSVETMRSDVLGREWTYSVYLPPGYDTSELRYPVLYLLHGSGGDETDWRDGQDALDSLIAVGAVPPAIAVAPATGTSWWVDGQEPFETAFLQDLVPHVDRQYRTISSREGRAAVGFSMGGYGALRYGLAHPDVFGAAVLLSPALYDDLPPDGSSARTSGAFGAPFDAERWTRLNYPHVLDASDDAPDVPVFIVTGDDDWHHPEGTHHNVEQQTVRLYGRLHKEGGRPAELRVLDGGHSWEVWGPGFEDGLAYVFQFLKPPQPACE